MIKNPKVGERVAVRGDSLDFTWKAAGDDPAYGIIKCVQSPSFQSPSIFHSQRISVEMEKDHHVYTFYHYQVTRLKPKKPKVEAPEELWLNVYPYGLQPRPHLTKAMADKIACDDRIACVKYVRAKE